MITLVNIDASVTRTLKSKFNIDVVGNEVKEGFTKPSFFVQLLPTGSNLDTINVTSHSVTVIITYFTKKHDDLENMMVVDELRKLFLGKLPVLDRQLDISNFRVDFAGENRYPQISFDLHYFDSADKAPEDHELAKEVIFKEVI